MSAVIENMGQQNRRKEGSALLVAVMMLVLMGLIGIAALDTMTKDRQVAGFQQRARLAYYAADAGVAAALDRLAPVNNRTQTPLLPTTAIGDAVIYPYGQPIYTADPTVANPIVFFANGNSVPNGMSLAQNNGPSLQTTLWKIRVQGQTFDGGTSNVEVMATHPLPKGY